MLHRLLPALAGLVLAFCCAAAAAQEAVRFASLDRPVILDGYLYRQSDMAKRPALVLMHGCGGLVSERTGRINSRETDWAGMLNRLGYIVLLVDSFRPRNHGESCSQQGYDASIYAKRTRDAYGALLYLQALPFVRADRVGIIGWSQGGGTVLYAIGPSHDGRPAQLPQDDFRAAVAFYPARCDEQRRPGWTTATPLLVLNGAGDVWTPAAPCQALIDAAAARGAPAQIVVYPGAYHDFDWPGMAVHESPAYRTPQGVVPIQGIDPAARQDALARVPAFLARYLGQ